MAGKSGRRAGRKQLAEAPAASFKNEVILWAVLAVSIILFISNFGIAGGVGRLFSGLLFGLFGLCAYIFPFILFAGTAFLISNKNNPVATVKMVASALFFIFLCMFLELITGSSKAASPIDSFLWARKGKRGGGLFGGLLTWLIRSNLGTVSAYIINIIVLIICLVLITQRSLWKPIESGSKKAYHKAKDIAKEEVVIQQQRYVQHRQRRMDNKVVGVSMDTSMKALENQRRKDAVNELHPKENVLLDFPIHMMEETNPKGQGQDKEFKEKQNTEQEKRIEQKVEPATIEGIPEEEISVVSQKVVLKPSMPSSIDKADNILEKTSELFSEMLPKMNSGTMELEDINLEESGFPGDESNAGLEMDNDLTVDDLQISGYQSGNPGIDIDLEKKQMSDATESGSRFTDETAPEEVKQEESFQKLQEQEAKIQRSISGKTKLDGSGAGTAGSLAIAGNTAAKQVDMPAVAALVPREIVKREYIHPTPELLKLGDPSQTGDSRQHLQETALKLQQTLKNFGVNITILNVSCGPSVTRYEIQPEMGVKVSKIVNLADDIKLNLAAADIRIEAPIPGKAAIGIEVPNKENVPVMFRSLVESEEFKQFKSPCTFAVGKDIAGKVVVTDICKMPHLLIAGATGSGKSVCINTIIMSILYKADPDDVKLIMVDPKVVELNVYNGIPHLLLPVVTDPKKAAGALHWAVSEMMDRYNKFAASGVRDIKGYNAKIKKLADMEDENKPQKMPYIVIIVDELADLMMAAPGDVEDAICRLAQLAAGIHLIIATQRPSVNVITGLIKANMPSRIAFSVTSGTDSRTILDMNGAEKLLGKGDMLFYPQGFQKPVRVQGAFVSDSEVTDVVEFLTEQNGSMQYNQAIEEQVTNAASGSGTVSIDAAPQDDRDVYFSDAAKLLIEKDKASVSMLQRYFKIGFNRAARIMDQLEEAGVVGAEEGTKPRKILMSPEEFAQYEEEVL